MLAGWPIGQPSLGPIYTHGAVEAMNRAYREAGVELPATTYAAERAGRLVGRADRRPPSAMGRLGLDGSGRRRPRSPRAGCASEGPAAGGPSIAGSSSPTMSDWPACSPPSTPPGPRRVWLTHGYTAVVARYLRERGRSALPVATRYEGRHEESAGSEGAEG